MYKVFSNVETAINALFDAKDEQRQLSNQSIDTEYNYAEATYAERLTVLFNGMIIAQQLYMTDMLNATERIIAQAEQDGARA
jgi:hypothetical protein